MNRLSKIHRTYLLTFLHVPLSILILILFAPIDLQAQCPDLIRGPYLQAGDDGQPTPSTNIYWRTETGENMIFCSRDLGDTANFSCIAIVGSNQSIFQPLDENFTSNKMYSVCTVYNYHYDLITTTSKEYEIRCDDHTVQASGIVKADSPNKPLNIWIIGDGGENGSDASSFGFEEVIDAFQNYVNTDTLDLLMLLGDNAYNMEIFSPPCGSIDICTGNYCEVDGSDYAYQESVFTPFQELLTNIIAWPAIGNHEVTYHISGEDDTNEDYNLNEFLEIFPSIPKEKGYYSYDYGDIHFICLNSEIEEMAFSDDIMEMKDWLLTDLVDHTEAAWTIVYFHHPIYSASPRDKRHTMLPDVEGEMQLMIDSIAPILDEYDVDLVLTGHNHHYERSFLIDGQYNDTTFTSNNPDMLLDDGCGGCYPDNFDVQTVESNFTKTDKGTVYAVLGSSSKTDKADTNHDFFNHPIMRPFDLPTNYTKDGLTVLNGGRGLFERGSIHLSINDNVLTAEFIAPDLDAPNDYVILDKFTITKNNCEPMASFYADIEEDYVVSFRSTASNADSHLWDFGDGTTSSEVNPYHNYNNSGSYTVTLTVENLACNQESSYSIDIMVDPAMCPMNAEYDFSDDIPYVTQVNNYIKLYRTTINSGDTIILRAENFIELFPDNAATIIQDGALFEAFIEPCNGDMAGKNSNISVITDKTVFTDLTIAPNPFPQAFTLEFTINKEMPISIEIHNLTGHLEQTIFKNKIYPSGQYSLVIDSHYLRKGVYTITLRTQDDKITKKLIKL